MRRGVTLLTAIVAIGGCTAPDRVSNSTAIRTDSAGIEIISYSVAAIEAAPLYVVSDSFDLSIGLADGEDPYLFGLLAAAAEMPDGTILVADGSAMQLRFFSADGQFIRSVGRRGSGPREFESIHRLWLGQSDTVYVWDTIARRLASVAGQGEFFATTPVAMPEYYHDLLGVLRGSAYLFQESGYGPVRSDGMVTSMEWLVRVSSSGTEGRAVADTLIGYGNPYQTRFMFSTHAAGGIHPDGMWWSPGNVPEVRVLDETGQVRTIVRWEEADRTVRPEHIQTVVENMLALVPPDQAAGWREAIEQRGHYDRFPSVDEMASQPDGRAWVLRFQRPGEDLRGEMLVFGPDGDLQARIENWRSGIYPLPNSFDSILRRTQDERGVPVVRRHPLIRVTDGVTGY